MTTRKRPIGIDLFCCAGGMSLGWTWDFLKPIRAGDRLHVKYRIGAMRQTKKRGWGIVNLASELINQHGEVVQKGEHKLMILRRLDAQQRPSL